jgi:hypothetical protein
MNTFSKLQQTRIAGLAGILSSCIACLATAQEPSTEPAEEPSSPFTLTLGADIVTAYYFRGIPQENQGLIVQPYVTGALKVFESESGWLNAVTLSGTTWNSLHNGPTGEGDDPAIWYESDAIVAATFTVFQDWTLTLGYTAYFSPNDSYNTYQEVNLAVTYDDSDLLGKWALHPRALLAVEIDDQADAGNSAFQSVRTREGVYLELGLTPQFDVIERSAGNIAVAFPLTLGLSLSDYYETAEGDDETFGFFDVGAELIVPLDLPGPGAWTLRGGPHAIWLGDNAAEIGSGITGGDDFDVWFKVGLSVSF